MVQLSYLYMTTGKTIALNIQTFVGKVMSLLFNTLSRFVTAFVPRSKHLLILMTESKEQLKRLLMKAKEERVKVGLRLNIQKLRSWYLVPSLHGK